MNSKNKNLRDLYRGINDNLMKDANGNLLAGSNNILNRWKNYFTVIHSFNLHSMDPYMAGKPVDIEIVNDNKTSHINYIITN
jgi:hypothetical protein